MIYNYNTDDTLSSPEQEPQQQKSARTRTWQQENCMMFDVADEKNKSLSNVCFISTFQHDR